MEAISKLVFNLLAQKKNVVFPNLGTLCVEQEPESLTSSKLRVPKSHVAFRPEQDGSTLPEIIADKAGLTFKDAKSQYNRWMSNIKRQAKNDILTINGVCELIPLPNGNYRVDISAELDRILNPFDIQTIHLSPLAASSPEQTVEAEVETAEEQPIRILTHRKQPAKDAPEKKVSPEPVILQTVPVQKQAQEAPQKQEAGKPPQPKQPEPKKKSKGIGIAAAILLLLGLSGGFYAYRQGIFTNPQPAGDTNTSQPVQPEASVLPENTGSSEMENQPTVATEVPEQTTGASSTASSDNTSEVYHLIAGVFSTRENAERFLTQFDFDPAQTTLIPTTGERFMVSIGKYTSKREADRAMSVWQAKIPGAWVSKRKK